MKNEITKIHNRLKELYEDTPYNVPFLDEMENVLDALDEMIGSLNAFDAAKHRQNQNIAVQEHRADMEAGR